jgi:hypothetical protein
MQLKEALEFTRSILGDQSESVWSDVEIVRALNLSNKRIMARIVEQNPEQYIVSLEHFFRFQGGASDPEPVSIEAGEEVVALHVLLGERWTSEAAPAKLQTFNPIKIMRLFYSSDASLNNRIEIPLVPFNALDERTEKNALEYEVYSNMAHGVKYRAAYSAGSLTLFIRPVPSIKMYLKIYWAEAGVMTLGEGPEATIDEDQRLLFPYFLAADDEGYTNLVNTPKSEAVCFDAAWTLSFKDQSMREACAMERERILATQLTPMSPNEAY